MLNAIRNFARRVIDAVTCHHALYGYLAATYYLGCTGLIPKEQVAEIATAIYFVLSARG